MLRGYVLGFDFGEVRIGVAGGSSELGIATPLATITGSNNDEKFLAIGKLITEWHPNQLVVGLPCHLDGQEHEMTRLARKFGQRLSGRFNLPVVWVDERLTSAEANEMLGASGVSFSRRKLAVDQVAAMRILQAWFDQQSVQVHPT